MKSDLGLSATSFGLAVAAFFWIYAPIQLVLGRLCDRFSVYRLLALGTLLWSVSTLADGLRRGFVSLLILRLVLGVGESIVFPGSSKIICAACPAGAARACECRRRDRRSRSDPRSARFVGGRSWRRSAGARCSLFSAWPARLWLLPWARGQAAADAGRTTPKPRSPSASAEPLVACGRWASAMRSAITASISCSPSFRCTWPVSAVLPSCEMTMLATLGYAVQARRALSLGHLSDCWTRSGRSEAVIRRWMLSAASWSRPLDPRHLPRPCASCSSHPAVRRRGAAAALSLNLYAVAQMFAGRARPEHGSASRMPSAISPASSGRLSRASSSTARVMAAPSR